MNVHASRCVVFGNQAHLGDLDGLAKNEPMVDGVKYEPTKVSGRDCRTIF